MKEELLKELVPILQATKEGLLAGIEILKQQSPQLINEIYKWEASIGIIGIAIGVVLLVISIYLIKNWKKLWEKACEQDTEPCLVATLTVSLILGLFFFFFNLCKVIQITVAPKLYLLQYIAGLME